MIKINQFDDIKDDQTQTRSLKKIKKKIKKKVKKKLKNKKKPSQPDDVDKINQLDDDIKDDNVFSVDDLAQTKKNKKKKKKKKGKKKKKSKPSPPPPSVTFNFIGIRPTQLHLQNNQTKMILDTCSTKIIWHNLSLNDSVYKFKKLIKKEFKIPKKRSLLIMYANIKLLTDKCLLKNYGITNHSWFIVAIYDHQHKLINPQYGYLSDEERRYTRDINRKQRDMDAIKRRLQRIRQLKTGVKTPIIDKTKLKTKLNDLKIDIVCGLDIITMEANVNCMKLPSCGHILSQNSLYQYTLSQFRNRNQILKCPHSVSQSNKLCDKKWDYPVIKQYLLSNIGVNNNTLFEYNLLELLSARNVIEIDYECQKCIKCCTLFYRNKKDNNVNNKTICPFCVNTSFCWRCNNEWTDDHLCPFQIEVMEIISSCPGIKIGKVKDVPSVRSCPKCNQLIQHVAACKHMTCSFCKTAFCFVCLKPKKNGQWQCGNSGAVCPVARRQLQMQNDKLLIKLNRTSFELFS